MCDEEIGNKRDNKDSERSSNVSRHSSFDTKEIGEADNKDNASQ